MCFSATASFAASAVLGAAGVITTSQVKNPRELPIASIPWIFAIQQFFEGLLWLEIAKGGSNILLYTYAFLFFALFWWPFFTPIMTFLLETDKKKKELMFIFWLVGIYIGVSQYIIFAQHPIPAQIANHCIYYKISSPLHSMAVAMYLLATVGVSLLSSKKVVRIFGTWLGIFAGMAAYMYLYNFTSVWCFFGAILSFILCFYFVRKNNRPKQ